MSTIKVDNLETTSGASLFPDKAWANVNQIGTNSIRNDGGFSSMADLGTGYFSLNFSNTASTSNWCVVAMGNGNGPSDHGATTPALRSSSGASWQNPLFSTTSVEVETGKSSAVNNDLGYIGVQVVY